MPAPLALALCTIFVGALLWLDGKQSRGVSRALWIPTVWILVAFSKPLAVWFGSTAENSMEAGSPLDRAFLIALLALALIVLTKRRFDWRGAIRDNRWVILLIVYMLVSVAWSSIPLVSFKRWTRDIIVVVMGFMILSEANPRLALQTILRRVTYVLIPFSWLLIKYYPRYGVQFGRYSGARMWIGVGLQKNHLALLCIIAAVFLFWTLFRRWNGRDRPVVRHQVLAEGFILILTFLLLIGPRRSLTYSATSTIVLIFAVMTAAVLYLRRKKHGAAALSAKTLKIAVLVIVIYGTITPFLGRLSIFDISSALNRDDTLTGRSQIWAFLVPYALKQPVLGHGFGGFWTTEMRELTASHAHNGYLDTILNIGFIGLLLVGAFLLSCCDKARRSLAEDFDWGVLAIAFLLMAALHNITESTINTLTSSLIAIVLFFSMIALKTGGDGAPDAEQSEPAPGDVE